MTTTDPAMTPAQTRLLDALRAANGPLTGAQLIARVAERHGHRLARQTVSTALNRLAALGLAAHAGGGPGEPRRWHAVDGDA